MAAFLILFLAALSRLLPHAMHGTAYNFTAVGGSLLFFGARRRRWQAAIAMAVMALTDVYLTKFVYAFPFHVSDYLVTWAWYAAACLLGSQLLRKVTVSRVAAGVFASATGFFLLSNFVVWVGGGMYAHSLAGLGVCLAAGLPFYANDLASTALTAGALFGVPVLAARLIETMRGNQTTAI